MQAAQTGKSGDALRASYLAWIDHANKQIANWQAALANYGNTEQATQQAVNKLAGQR